MDIRKAAQAIDLLRGQNGPETAVVALQSHMLALMVVVDFAGIELIGSNSRLRLIDAEFGLVKAAIAAWEASYGRKTDPDFDEVPTAAAETAVTPAPASAAPVKVGDTVWLRARLREIDGVVHWTLDDFPILPLTGLPYSGHYELGEIGGIRWVKAVVESVRQDRSDILVQVCEVTTPTLAWVSPSNACIDDNGKPGNPIVGLP
jgi:hypothetical protein